MVGFQSLLITYNYTLILSRNLYFDNDATYSGLLHNQKSQITCHNMKVRWCRDSSDICFISKSKTRTFRMLIIQPIRIFRILDFESVGRRFESCRAYHKIISGVEQLALSRYLFGTNRKKDCQVMAGEDNSEPQKDQSSLKELRLGIRFMAENDKSL